MQHPTRKTREGGQTMIMITLALIPMFGAIGMVTDLGYMHFVKMQAQTAAEVAARSAIINFHATVGGAVLTSCTQDGVVCAPAATACPTSIVTPADSLQVGCMYAARHGFSATGNQNVTYVTGGTGLSGVSSSPPTAPGINNVQFWVTYAVAQRVPQLFSYILGPGFSNGLVAARSTGAVVGSSDCIYALNQTADNAISVGGTASLVSTCGLYDNSNAVDALSCNGHGSSYAFKAPEYDVVGNATCTSFDPDGATSPNTGVSVTADPLASLPVPSTGPYTCDYVGLTTFNASSATTIIPVSPGVYCGGILVKKGIAHFASGTYTLVGGGLSTQDGNSTIDAGAGVFIYNTFGVGNGTTYDYAPFNIKATSVVTMKPLTAGTYAGILIFENRTAPASNDNFGGGSSAVYQGVIYAKNAAVTMYGNSSLNTAYTLLVADTISLVGTTGFNNDYSSLPNGSPIQMVSVVE